MKSYETVTKMAPESPDVKNILKYFHMGLISKQEMFIAVKDCIEESKESK